MRVRDSMKILRNVLAVMLILTVSAGLTACEKKNAGEKQESSAAEESNAVNNYTNIQLIYFAKNYYYAKTGQDAAYSEVSELDDNMLEIHLFNRKADAVVDCARYTVRRDTAVGVDQEGEEVDLIHY